MKKKNTKNKKKKLIDELPYVPVLTCPSLQKCGRCSADPKRRFCQDIPRDLCKLLRMNVTKTISFPLLQFTEGMSVKCEQYQQYYTRKNKFEALVKKKKRKK